jgi:hypothetical protein
LESICTAKFKRGTDVAVVAFELLTDTTTELVDPDSVIYRQPYVEHNTDGEPQADIVALHALVCGFATTYTSVPKELLRL